MAQGTGTNSTNSRNIIIAVIAALALLCFYLWYQVSKVDRNHKAQMEEIKSSQDEEILRIEEEIGELSESVSEVAEVVKNNISNIEKEQIDKILNQLNAQNSRLQKLNDELKTDNSLLLERINQDSINYEDNLGSLSDSIIALNEENISYMMKLESSTKEFNDTISKLNKIIAETKFEENEVKGDELSLVALDKRRRRTNSSRRLKYFRLSFEFEKKLKANEVINIIVDNGEVKGFGSFGSQRSTTNNKIFYDLEVPREFKITDRLVVILLHNNKVIFKKEFKEDDIKE